MSQKTNKTKVIVSILLISLIVLSSSLAFITISAKPLDHLSFAMTATYLDMQPSQTNVITAIDINGTEPYSYIWQVATSNNVSDTGNFEFIGTSNPLIYQLNESVAYITFKCYITDDNSALGVGILTITDSTSVPIWTLNYPLPAGSSWIEGQYSNSTVYAVSADNQNYTKGATSTIDAFSNLTLAGGGSLFVHKGNYTSATTAELPDNCRLSIDAGVENFTYTIASGADCSVQDWRTGTITLYVSGNSYASINMASGTTTLLAPWNPAYNATVIDLISIYDSLDWQDSWNATVTSIVTGMGITTTQSLPFANITSVPTIGSYDYKISVAGSSYLASFANGTTAYSSTNASYVVDSAKNSLTSGGSIYFKSGSYVIPNTIIFERGAMGDDSKFTWTVYGDGIVTTKLVAGGNINVIQVRNSTRVNFHSFSIDLTGQTSAQGIVATADGIDEQSLGPMSSMIDITVFGSNTDETVACFSFTNFMNCYFENLRGQSTAAIGFELLADSSSVHYGNSVFDSCSVWSSGSYGWLLNSTSATYTLNFLDFQRCESIGGPDYGLYIGYNVIRNSWYDLDIEGGNVGAIYLDCDYSAQNAYNHIYSGYVDGVNTIVTAQGNIIANTFENLYLSASSSAITDYSSYTPDHYKNINIASGTIDGLWGCTFEGFAGGNKYFTCYTTFSDISNGTSVTIKGAGMWDTPNEAIVSLPTQGYAWASITNSTNVVIYFAGGGSTVSGTLFTGWNP